MRSVVDELFEEARSSSTEGQNERCQAALNAILQLDPVNQSAKQLLGTPPQKPPEKTPPPPGRSRLWYLALLVPVLAVCLVGVVVWKLRKPERPPIPVQVQAPRLNPIAVWTEQNMKEGLYQFRLRLPEVLDCLDDLERSGEKAKATAFRAEIRRYYAGRARTHETAGNLGLAVENYRVLVEMLGAKEFESKLAELQAKDQPF